MRFLLLAILIVLLPLRGWMGDAMATDMAIHMATGFGNTTKTAVSSAHKTSLNGQFEQKLSSQAAPASSMPAQPDCGGHASSEAAPSEAQAVQDEHCKPCQSCQACHTVALPSSLQSVKRAFAAPLTLPTAAAHFTSAYSALGQKPPIS